MPMLKIFLIVILTSVMKPAILSSLKVMWRKSFKILALLEASEDEYLSLMDAQIDLAESTFSALMMLIVGDGVDL